MCGWNRSTQPLPRAFAAYIAVSALLMRSSAVVGLGAGERDPDAHADAHLLVGGVERARSSASSSRCGDASRLRLVGDVVEQDAELVAAEARGGVALAQAAP